MTNTLSMESAFNLNSRVKIVLWKYNAFRNEVKIIECECFILPQTKLREATVFTPVCDPFHTSVEERSLSGGSLSRGEVFVRVTPRRVMGGWYAPYWNAFLFISHH